MKITEISIKRPIYVTVVFMLLAILGYLSYVNLSAELMPKFTPPVLNVQIIYPGASPSEVENSLTRKAEDALSGMEGIDQMQSLSLRMSCSSSRSATEPRSTSGLRCAELLNASVTSCLFLPPTNIH